MQSSIEQKKSWLDQSILSTVNIRWETVILGVFILLAVFTRFYDLESRVMSHDETIHVYHNSWSLFRGTGYRHDPLSHGPFQTHVVALSYFLLGDSDFSARVPAVLFSIATVVFVWAYRRYFGKAGTLITMLLMLISPYMLYYGRYVRNESYAAFAGVVLLWAILRYLETGNLKYTYWVTFATVLHFSAKETAFIYSAQALMFLSAYFIFRLGKIEWQNPGQRKLFYSTFIGGVTMFLAAGFLLMLNRQAGSLGATQTAVPAIPGESLPESLVGAAPPIVLVLGLIGVLVLVAAIFFLVRGISWQRLRVERSFGLLVVIGTMVLPQLSAFPVYFAGWNIPSNATEVINMQTNPADIWHVAIFLVPMILVSIVIGLLWNKKAWLINAAIFYGIFTILYTTVFTNGAGFFTGLVGSLGYWLKQQGVQRGSQPSYYYMLVQIPVYEYLPALASLLGFGLIVFGKKPLLRFSQAYQEYKESKRYQNDQPEAITQDDARSDGFTSIPGNDLSDDRRLIISPDRPENPERQDLEYPPVIALLGFWVISSILAYSLAGEKMPWLTVHITWSMVLFGGWSLGYIADCVDWQEFTKLRGWLLLVVLAVFLVSAAAALGSLLGSQPPFQGQSLDQLSATSTFFTSLLVAIGSGIILWKLAAPWPVGQFLRVMLLTIFVGFGVLTARTAIQSSYINYDNANELLVYAHSAGGVKEVMRQVEDISRRTTGGLAIPVAYDGEYPFWWYLRNYKDTRYFGSTPSKTLREAPVIIVGDSNFGKIEPIVGQAYEQFEYIRLWWPNQDYFGLTLDRVVSDLSNPEMRAALFDIWLNRDYTKYGQVTGKDMSLENWSPSSRMRLYIRKDTLAKIWNYGSSPVVEEIAADPYEGKQVDLPADLVFGSPGVQPGEFQRPRGVAIAADGSLYIADTDNHRVQHMGVDGNVINTWGSFGDITQGTAPGGTFNQPWGIEVDAESNVYVADTWNHRVQKFTPEGEFIRMWGFFGQAEQPEAFWGPRDIAIDDQDRVFITDTGNKRVVVFSTDGVFITQFGTAGLDIGQFDEPVGIAIDTQGEVYIADTWNQRIQVFQEVNGVFTGTRSWDVAGWYGQSLDNKPFLAVDAAGNVFATDPEGYRVLQFKNNGDFVRYWGDVGVGFDGFGLAGAVEADQAGGLWVSDAGNSRMMYFKIPE